MGFLAGFRKRRAIRRYLEVCAPALPARYGFEATYSPARVVTTLKALGLDLEHREYACAMFATAEDFAEWARKEAAAVTFVKPSEEQLRERYATLRDEVTERHNGGSPTFLPKPENSGGGGSLETTADPDAAAMSSFRWYR